VGFDAEEMESSSKLDLKALVIVRFSKEGCISLVAGRRPFHVACKHD